MSVSLQESSAYCHEMMRSAARNFYYGMRLLPEDKRHGMYALYTFMRLLDDIADGDESTSVDQRRVALEQWRDATHAAIAGQSGAHPLWPAFGKIVRQFSIPQKTFDDAIDGQLQDMDHAIYKTFDDLYGYCYRVASTVGIASVHIWGFCDQSALQLAEERGIAFQLTNILRDLREDAGRGRQYLPTEDFKRFNIANWDPSSPPGRDFTEMMHFQVSRARDYYQRSAALEDLINPDARASLRIMTAIYRRILERIGENPLAVLHHRIRLSGVEKLALVARHAWRAQWIGITERAS